MAHIDHADAPQLHIVADQLRRVAGELIPAHQLDLHRIVGDKPVSALNELQSRLTLADTAVTHQKHTLAVDLHQHAVGGNAGRQIAVQAADHIRLKVRGVLIGDEQVPVIFLRQLQTFGKGLHPVTDNKSRNIILQKAFQRRPPPQVGQGVQIGTLHPPDDLQPVWVEVVIKARKLHSGSVYIRRRQHRRVIVL